MSLFGPASITNVTLGHITKSQSPTGEISSAPREFSVYVSRMFSFILCVLHTCLSQKRSQSLFPFQGLRTATETGTYLGTLVYNQDGAAFQTFELLVSIRGCTSMLNSELCIQSGPEVFKQGQF